jgi:hypothetical protein
MSAKSGDAIVQNEGEIRYPYLCFHFRADRSKRGGEDRKPGGLEERPRDNLFHKNDASGLHIIDREYTGSPSTTFREKGLNMSYAVI